MGVKKLDQNETIKPKSKPKQAKTTLKTLGIPKRIKSSRHGKGTVKRLFEECYAIKTQWYLELDFKGLRYIIPAKNWQSYL